MRLDSKYLDASGNNFTALRLVLASSVIYSHCYNLVRGGVNWDDLAPVLGTAVSTYAVDGFFFLSGFLVYPSLLRLRNPFLFIAARLSRIWPGLAFSIAVTVIGGLAFTSLTPGNYFSGQTLGFIAGNLSFIKAFYHLSGVTCGQVLCNVNGSLWTLPFEIRCYLILLLLGVIGVAASRNLMRIFVALTIAAAVVWDIPLVHLAAQAHIPGSMMYHIDTFHRLWPLFALGMLAYVEKSLIDLRWSALIALFALHLIAVHFQVFFEMQTRAILVGYGVLCFGFLTAKTKSFSSGWPDYSYGTYIFGGPVMIAIYLLTPVRGPYIIALETLAGTLLMAAISWHLIENPSLSAFKKFRKSVAKSGPERPAEI